VYDGPHNLSYLKVDDDTVLEVKNNGLKAGKAHRLKKQMVIQP